MTTANIKTVIIAHNEFDFVRTQLRALVEIGGLSYENMIVVDNFSSDGLKDWLLQRDDIDYILCDEKVESYAEILNTVFHEFICEEDVFLLNPQSYLLPNTIGALQAALYCDEKMGAVYAEKLARGDSPDLDNIEKAIRYADEKEGNKACDESMGLPTNGLLIRNQMLKAVEADPLLHLPGNILTDMAFRGLRLGFRYVKVNHAFLYQLTPHNSVYDRMFTIEADRTYMKEKWDMNYFSVMHNYDLVCNIKATVDAAPNVLEIGCDCGANLLYVKNRFPNASVYGVELNPVSAEIAGYFAHVQVGNIEDRTLDYQNIKFDYIMFGDVLEHLRDPEGVIVYCRQLLKSSGRIIASIPNLMHFYVMHDLLNGNFTYKDLGLLDRTHIHFFTYNEIVKMFERAGYFTEKIGYITQRHCADEERDFVQKLMSITDDAEEFMFLAYQYIVVAGIDHS